MKSIFDNWNIQTQLWLRRIAYDRLSTGKTMGVFVLSAFCNGFYPGYYMTFVLGGLYVYAGRGVRFSFELPKEFYLLFYYYSY